MTKVITFAGVNLLISGFSPVMDATLQDNSIRRRHTGYRPETANLINIYNMCGIVAIFNISGPMGQLRDKALRMSQKIRHRGPDWTGIYTGHTAILAHERLSIVDPQSGRQPLFSCDRKQILAVNGEIYNHQYPYAPSMPTPTPSPQAATASLSSPSTATSLPTAATPVAVPSTTFMPRLIDTAVPKTGLSPSPTDFTQIIIL